MNTQTKTKTQTHTGVVAAAAFALFGLALYGYAFGGGKPTILQSPPGKPIPFFCAGENKLAKDFGGNCCAGLVNYNGMCRLQCGMQGKTWKGTISDSCCDGLSPDNASQTCKNQCASEGQQASSAANGLCCFGLKADKGTGSCMLTCAGQGIPVVSAANGQCCDALVKSNKGICSVAGKCAEAGWQANLYEKGCCQGLAADAQGLCFKPPEVACTKAGEMLQNFDKPYAPCCAGLVQGNNVCQIPGCGALDEKWLEHTDGCCAGLVVAEWGLCKKPYCVPVGVVATSTPCCSGLSQDQTNTCVNIGSAPPR